LRLVKIIKSYCGIKKRSKSVDLFENQTFLARAKGEAKRSIVGVDNVYTQHKPLISKLIEKIQSGSLPETSYPFLEGVPNVRPKFHQTILFIVGGVTYEEAAYIAGINKNAFNYLIGGTHMLNTSSFLNALKENFVIDEI